MAVMSGVIPYKVGYGSTTGPTSYDHTNRPTLILNGITGPVDSNAIILKSSDPRYDAVYISNNRNVVTFKVMNATFAALPNHTHTENTASSYTQNATTDGASAGTPVYDPSAEVIDATDLSGVTFSAIAVGI